MGTLGGTRGHLGLQGSIFYDFGRHFGAHGGPLGAIGVPLAIICYVFFDVFSRIGFVTLPGGIFDGNIYIYIERERERERCMHFWDVLMITVL